MMRGTEVPLEQTHAQRGSKEAVGVMSRKGGSENGKRGCEGNMGSVRREMWRCHPDDDNVVEARTHAVWSAVSSRLAAVCCAGPSGDRRRFYCIYS